MEHMFSKSYSSSGLVVLVLVSQLCHVSLAFIPFLDGGKSMPMLYDGWFNEQIAKQASTAVSKAISAGKKKMEVNFPPVPNVEEVRFGTPLNQKFGKSIVEKELQVTGGYKPGSELSRDLIAYSNVYWAKKLSPSFGGKNAAVVTSERVNFSLCKKMGNNISQTGFINNVKSTNNNEGIICINPGGEETWERLITKFGSSNNPFLILNNAYSTSYDLGNTKGFEEVYYLKRVSKGWIFRAFPGKWQAYIERPDGSCELLQEFDTKPTLRDASKLVREESFKRYAIFNDRWSQGFGGRL